MLSWRTPFWLFIFCVCALVMTYFTITYFPQGNVRSVRSSLLPYNKSDANEIIIKYSDPNKAEIKFLKKNGIWYIDDGFLVRANSDRISLLFNALVGDSIRERITKRQRIKRELTLDDFGLENYKTELIIKRGKDAVSITIGNNAPYENTVFVKSSNSSEVYIVEGVISDIIPSSLDDIRDRTLFPYPISLIKKLEVVSENENSFILEKDELGTVWEMISPVRAPASAAVDSLLQNFGFASINSFVWHPVGNIVSKKTISEYIAPYGLGERDAKATIRVWIDGLAEPVEFRIGRSLPNESGLVYAFSSVDNSVFTLDQVSIAPFFMGFETMRNHSVFAIPSHNISSVSYKRGLEYCLLSLNEKEDWEITIPSKQPIAPGSVEAFIEELSSVSDYGIVSDDVLPPMPLVELQFVDNLKNINSLQFYYDNTTNVYLKTTSSSFTTRVLPESLPMGLLEEDFIASFRSKEIFNFEASGVNELTLSRGRIQQNVYSSASGEWRSNDSQIVSTNVILSLIEKLSSLTAERVAKLVVTDVKSFGFAEPKAELIVVFANDIVRPYGMPSLIIQIGNQLPSGEFYLRIKGEQEIFVVSEEFAKMLVESTLY